MSLRYGFSLGRRAWTWMRSRRNERGAVVRATPRALAALKMSLQRTCVHLNMLYRATAKPKAPSDAASALTHDGILDAARVNYIRSGSRDVNVKPRSRPSSS